MTEAQPEAPLPEASSPVASPNVDPQQESPSSSQEPASQVESTPELVTDETLGQPGIRGYPTSAPLDSRELAILAARYTEFAGPLPPPSTIAGYESAIPGGANRIFVMAEEQAAHRQAMERLVVEAQCRAQDRGPVLGFILCALVLLLGGFLIYEGREVSGLVAILTALVSVVVVFVTGKRSSRKERRSERRKEADRKVRVPKKKH